MSLWIPIGLAALALFAVIAWSLCRAAARMDDLFDDLDRELAAREARLDAEEERRPC